jgi:hypothetical protein
VFVWLRKPPEVASPEPADSASAVEDLERLAAERSLHRQETTVTLGHQPFLELRELVTAPGDPQAEAGTLVVYPAAFFKARRTSVDEGIRKFFRAMPPGIDTVACHRMEVVISDGRAPVRDDGSPIPDSADLSPEIRWSGPGKLVLRDERLTVHLEWSDDTAQRLGTLEMEFSLRSGLLSMSLHPERPAKLPLAFLPKGTLVRFESFAMEESSRVLVKGMELLAGDGEEVLAAEEVRFQSSVPLDLRLLMDGGPEDRLRRLTDWTMEWRVPRGTFAGMRVLPCLASADWKAGRFKADRWLLGPGEFRWEAARVSLDAGTLSFARGHSRQKGLETTYALEKGQFDWASQGLVMGFDELNAHRNSWLTWEWRLNGFSLALSTNPLAMARLLREAGRLKKGIGEAVRSGNWARQGLQLPEWVPDGELRAVGGVMRVPGLPGVLGEPEDIPIEGTVRINGGIVDSASVQLCLGGEGCPEFDGQLSVVGDPVGSLRSMRVSLGGARLVREILKRAPDGLRALSHISVQADLSPSSRSGWLEFSGQLELKGLSVFHRRVASEVLDIPGLTVQGKGAVHLTDGDLEISQALVSWGNVSARISVLLNRLRSKVPSVKIAVDFPRQNCMDLFSSIPIGMLPRLQDARLAGTMEFQGSFEVDLRDVRPSLKLDVTGDLSGCRAVTLGRRYNVARLNNEDFVWQVQVNGEDLGLEVGPGTPGYVPYAQIPKVVADAAYGTEDLAFFKHEGFRLGLIRRALILFLERGYYAYGGSTISQQLVKNLYLSREKTLARKLEEAVIVWQMEQVVSKERILELYINCIEYGPRIWGISHAARTYFGVHASKLGVMEAAFLMGLKPDPKYGYLQFVRGGLNQHWRKQFDRVLKRLLDMGSITGDQYAKALASPLSFNKPGTAVAPAVEEPVDSEAPVLEIVDEL